MEDKKMTEKESLDLITQMIQNSKKNLRLGNVNILLLWGYLCTITALVVYVLILITGNPLWNCKCSIKEKDTVTNGRSSSKKDAKKQAAYDMLTFVLEEE